MSNTQLDVWEKRWNAFERILPLDRDREDARGESKPYARYDTLKSLRQCLYVFGRSHYDFFKSGFEGDEGLHLEPSSEYPKEYVLSTILQQISFDLDVMARAAHFRLPSAAPQLRETLNKADILAYTALQPAIDAKLLTETTVVTCFQKSVSVRLMPYAPVALIGIPFSAIDCPRDLLAIPHEVGHYVYRHGILQNCQNTGTRFEALLANQLAGRPQWLLNWVEEIFADVYGCLVAGPVIGLSFQDLQAELSLQDFISEDGEHPTPALRPNVYHHALKHTNLCAGATQALENNWTKYLATRPLLGQLKFSGKDVAGQPVDVDQVNTEIAGVIDLIMNKHLNSLLNSNRSGAHSQNSVWKWDDLASGEAVEHLYDKFTERVKALPSTVDGYVPELLIAGEKGDAKMRLETPRAGNSVKPIERKPGATGLWIDALKASKGSGQPLTMPAEIWTALLSGNGWAIEGPGGNAH